MSCGWSPIFRSGFGVPEERRKALLRRLRSARPFRPDHCLALLDEEPLWEEGYEMLATLLENAGRREEALAVWHRHLRLTPLAGGRGTRSTYPAATQRRSGRPGRSRGALARGHSRRGRSRRQIGEHSGPAAPRRAGFAHPGLRTGRHAGGGTADALADRGTLRFPSKKRPPDLDPGG